MVGSIRNAAIAVASFGSLALPASAHAEDISAIFTKENLATCFDSGPLACTDVDGVTENFGLYQYEVTVSKRGAKTPSTNAVIEARTTDTSIPMAKEPLDVEATTVTKFKGGEFHYDTNFYMGGATDDSLFTREPIKEMCWVGKTIVDCRGPKYDSIRKIADIGIWKAMVEIYSCKP